MLCRSCRATDNVGYLQAQVDESCEALDEGPTDGPTRRPHVGSTHHGGCCSADVLFVPTTESLSNSDLYRSLLIMIIFSNHIFVAYCFCSTVKYISMIQVLSNLVPTIIHCKRASCSFYYFIRIPYCKLFVGIQFGYKLLT